MITRRARVAPPSGAFGNTTGLGACVILVRTWAVLPGTKIYPQWLMPESLSDTAERLDREDPLAPFRDRFVMPECRAYLDGNSLGPMPLAARERVTRLLYEEWGRRGVGGWNDGWIDLPGRLGAKIASIIGAHPDEVIVCDSTSVNFYKLLLAALELQSPRAIVLAERTSFPTNLYLAERSGAELSFLDLNPHGAADVETMSTALQGHVAVLALNHVAFKSGWLHPMDQVELVAREKGVLVLWDLSHSAGALPIDLNGCGAQLAVGCTYKYLNGGPGSPAYLYVARKLQDRLRSPIQGWLGHRAAFDFDPSYRPADGIERFIAGTPPILSMAAVEAGIEIAREAGMDRIRQKSILLTDLIVRAWEDRLEPLGIELASPREPANRGSHVSFSHPSAAELTRRLIEDHAVLPDFRRPDVIRFGVSALYNRFCEALTGIEALREATLEGNFGGASLRRGKVT